MGKLYHGWTTHAGQKAVEVVAGKKCYPLADRDDVRPYGEPGYDWGRYGPMSARLALAILADATGQARLSARLHLEYRWRVVAFFGRRDWTVTREDVLMWVLERCEEVLRGRWPIPDVEETAHA